MPLHNEECMDRVLNIVCPSDIYFVYRDNGFGEIIEDAAFDPMESNTEDDAFELEDMFLGDLEGSESMENDEVIGDQIVDNVRIVHRIEEGETSEVTRPSIVDTSLLARLSSSRFTVEHDADTVSCGGSSYATGSSFARREIPVEMKNSLRMQLALFLDKSEKNLRRRGDESYISRLKHRKRALELSCREPKLFHTQLSTTVM